MKGHRESRKTDPSGHESREKDGSGSESGNISMKSQWLSKEQGDTERKEAEGL
jgi:hypothetical protein